MATIYKNSGKSLTDTTSTTCYTTPALTTSIVKTIILSNTTSTTVNGSVKWVDSSNANVEYFIVNATPIPANTALTVLSTSAIVLEAGDIIKAISSNASGYIDVTISVQETS